MKNKIILLGFYIWIVLSISFGSTIQAQTITHTNTNYNTSIQGACISPTCSGTYVDNGGAGGNYSNNVSNFITICPNSPNSSVQVTFSSFNVENGWDYLYVFNGASTGDPQIGAYTGTTIPAVFVGTSTSGCLTFYFDSDFVNNAAGWQASIACVPNALGPAANTNAECSNATYICNNSSSFAGSSNGPGMSQEGCVGCIGGENYSSWYQFTASNSGSLAFTIAPGAAADYDFALFQASSCASLGAPVRCSFGATTGGTGLATGNVDVSEGPNGNGYVAPLNVVSGQTYYLLVNNWDNASPSFNFNWGGTATVSPPPVDFTFDTPICEGGNINLNAPTLTNTSYHWSGPNGFTSSSEDPIITGATSAMNGNYNLYVVINGCTSITVTKNITVNPIPTINPISNQSLCAGSSTTTINFSGGANTYNWTNNNTSTGLAANGSGDITSFVTTNPGGTSIISTITVTPSNSGCQGSPTNFTITVSPSSAGPAVGGNSPICAGTALSLTATGGVGGNYYWTGPNSFTSGLQNPTINPTTVANAGTYSAYHIVNGCSSLASTYNVIINPAPATPVPASNSPVCINSTINFTSPASTGTYEWTGPNGFSSNLQNPSIANATPANGGTYSLYIVENGCTSATGTININVVNPPITPSFTTNSPVCEGATITLNGSFYPFVNYVWTGPNGYSATGQSVSIPNAAVANAGNYSLSLAVSGCTSSATVHAVVISPSPSAPTLGGNSPICSGSSLNLTSNGGATGTYYWTGPNSYTSTVQNPIVNPATPTNAGAYSGYYIENGCTSSASIYNAVINPIPATPVASSNSPVCIGNAINLSTSTTTSGAYAWTGPNGYTSTAQNPTIPISTLANNGTYNLNIVENGCTSAVASVTVYVINPPITPAFTTNSPICEGGTITLSSTFYPIVSYIWSGPNGFTGSGQSVSITNVTSADAGNYTLSLAASGCTSVAAVQTVVINPTPASPIAGGNSPACVGAAINLTANSAGTGTYYWTGPNAYTSTTQNPSVTSATAAQAGNYSAVFIQNGCTSAASVYNVIVNPIPATPIASSNSPVCLGDNISLTTPIVNNATYSWSGPSFSSGIQNPTITSATLANAGTYSVMVTVDGCTSLQDTTTVTVTSPPITPVISSNSPVCEGSTLQLNTTSASANYFWTGPTGFTSSIQNPSVGAFSSAQAGTYNLYVVVGNCTSATASVIVQAANTPAATYNGPTQICGSDIVLSASASITPPTTVTSYDWFAPAGIGSGASLAYTFNQTAPAIANGFVVATSSDGCKDTVVFSVQLFDVPVAAFDTEQLCDGQSLQFNEQHDWEGNETSTPTFGWEFNGSTFSTTANPTYDFGGPGTYNITLTVSNTASAICSDAVTQQVIVLPLPTLDFTFLAECIKDVEFSGTATPDSLINEYSWDFNDGGTGTGSSTTHAFTVSGLYNVEFTATTIQGCTTSVTKPVQIDNVSIAPVIPNIITSNGDNVNDDIDINDLVGGCGDYEFNIFSRWGNVVYTQKNGGAPFIGKNNAGGWITPGVYFYALTFDDQKINGTITVIR